MEISIEQRIVENNERMRNLGSPRKRCTDYKLSEDPNDTAGTEVMDGDTCDVPSLMELTELMESHYLSEESEDDARSPLHVQNTNIFESKLESLIDSTEGELNHVLTTKNELQAKESELSEKLQHLKIQQHNPQFVRLRFRIWLALCTPLLVAMGIARQGELD
jgi:hypothetical protein